MKEQLRTLRLYLQSIVVVWNKSEYTTLEVMLQNMIAVINESTTESDLQKYVKVFEAWHDHSPNDHVAYTIYKEVDMIISGHFMSISDSNN